MREKWIEVSKDYDNKVFSFTKFPQRRKQIINEIIGKDIKKVLNLGAGPTSYLNKDLIDNDIEVVASDFCWSIFDEAKNKYEHPKLKYILADSINLPFGKETLECIISINSILPPARSEVYLMVKEIFQVLKKGGIFIAFLPSYDSAEKVIRNLGLNLKIDGKYLRVWDTVGWQCFHTPYSIEEMIEIAKFSDFQYKKVFLKTKQEIAELKKLYGIDTSKSLVYEYFLVAIK